MKKQKSLFSIIILLIIVFGLASCKSSKYPSPTNEYYINDYAGVLTAEVKNYILDYSTELYKMTKNKGYGATQVVVATFLFDSNEEIESYRREELYNKWKIGQNNMGLLIIMYYLDVQYDGYTLPEFAKFEVAIGTGMTQYLNEINLGIQMHDEIFPLYSDEELALIHYYFEALRRILHNAYPGEFSEFNYDDGLDYLIDLFYFEEYTYNSVGRYSGGYFDEILRSFGLDFLIFNKGSSIFVVLGFGLLLMGGFGGIMVKNKGGGGKSGGSGVFRRRN